MYGRSRAVSFEARKCAHLRMTVREQRLRCRYPVSIGSDSSIAHSPIEAS